MTVVAVVGNPKPGSRTLRVAEELAARVADQLGEGRPHVLDLALLGARLFDPEDAEVNRELRLFREAALAVVASPTYKASFTGLLKLFLDRVPNGGMSGVAIPVMTGGAATHSLAVEVHLRPVLVELGAALPTRGLYVIESQLPDLGEVLDAWWAQASKPLLRQLSPDGAGLSLEEAAR